MRTIPIPIALKQLIIANNKILQIHRRELMEQIDVANIDMMAVLKLNSTEWKLDIDNMIYVNVTEEKSE